MNVSYLFPENSLNLNATRAQKRWTLIMSQKNKPKKKKSFVWSWSERVRLLFARHWGGRRQLACHYHSTNCEMQSCAWTAISVQWGSVWNSTPLSFVVHSEGREDKQVYMYKEIIPGPGVRRRPSIAPKLSANFGIQESRPFGLLSLRVLFF